MLASPLLLVDLSPAAPPSPDRGRARQVLPAPSTSSMRDRAVASCHARCAAADLQRLFTSQQLPAGQLLAMAIALASLASKVDGTTSRVVACLGRSFSLTPESPTLNCLFPKRSFATDDRVRPLFQGMRREAMLDLKERPRCASTPNGRQLT